MTRCQRFNDDNPEDACAHLISCLLSDGCCWKNWERWSALMHPSHQSGATGSTMWWKYTLCGNLGVKTSEKTLQTGVSLVRWMCESPGLRSERSSCTTSRALPLHLSCYSLISLLDDSGGCSVKFLRTLTIPGCPALRRRGTPSDGRLHLLSSECLHSAGRLTRR